MKRFASLLLIVAAAVVCTSCRRNSGNTVPTKVLNAADLNVVKKNDFSKLKPLPDAKSGAGGGGMGGGAAGMKGGGPGMQGGGPGMMGGGPGQGK